jgi:hypothetical protein
VENAEAMIKAEDDVTPDDIVCMLLMAIEIMYEHDPKLFERHQKQPN